MTPELLSDAAAVVVEQLETLGAVKEAYDKLREDNQTLRQENIRLAETAKQASQTRPEFDTYKVASVLMDNLEQHGVTQPHERQDALTKIASDPESFIYGIRKLASLLPAPVVSRNGQPVPRETNSTAAGVSRQKERWY